MPRCSSIVNFCAVPTSHSLAIPSLPLQALPFAVSPAQLAAVVCDQLDVLYRQPWASKIGIHARRQGDGVPLDIDAVMRQVGSNVCTRARLSDCCAYYVSLLILVPFLFLWCWLFIPFDGTVVERFRCCFNATNRFSSSSRSNCFAPRSSWRLRSWKKLGAAPLAALWRCGTAAPLQGARPRCSFGC